MFNCADVILACCSWVRFALFITAFFPPPVIVLRNSFPLRGVCNFHVYFICWYGFSGFFLPSILGDKYLANGGNGGAPWWSYWSAGITNTIGPTMGTEALKYISYPAQVLVQSSKMIPVMLMGTLVYGTWYTFPEYLCTLLVADGVSTFAISKTSSKTIGKLPQPNAPLGYGLCFLNLAFDGFTNATQDPITASIVPLPIGRAMLFYKLSNTGGRIQAYAFDVIRASVPRLNLDDTFEQKNDISKAVEE